MYLKLNFFQYELQNFQFIKIFNDQNLKEKKTVKHEKAKNRVNFQFFNAKLTILNLLWAAKIFTTHLFNASQYLFQISSKSEYDRKVPSLVSGCHFVFVRFEHCPALSSTIQRRSKEP